MTREEAKTFMRKLWRETMTGTYAEEAIDMAIKALEQPEPCEDAVSRKAAVDALHQHFADGFEEDRWWNSTHVLATLKSLPSAQPERKKMSNKEWIDFLSEQFTVSRTTAREMLHSLMKWKAEDNFKKEFASRKEGEA